MTGLDMAKLLSEGGNLKNYWTYKGSLTTPACSEGLRWWVSGKIMTVTQAQMNSLLNVSDFSSRGQQKINAHAVGV
jgi:carbonic anhydrase